MNIKVIAALVVALSASIAAPAFASGYGPAPFYKPLVGAPASQRGQSSQTVVAERSDADVSQQGYGGVSAGTTQTGSRVAVTNQADLFMHH
jgi:hypothetical protein